MLSLSCINGQWGPHHKGQSSKEDSQQLKLPILGQVNPVTLSVDIYFLPNPVMVIYRGPGVESLPKPGHLLCFFFSF